MSINVPRPFPKMGTLLDLGNGYIHLKDPKRVHCCTSGKQAENGYITRLLGANVNNDTLSPPPPLLSFLASDSLVGDFWHLEPPSAPCR